MVWKERGTREGTIIALEGSNQDIESNKKKRPFDAETTYQIFLEATRDNILQAGVLRKWARLDNHDLS